MPGTRGRSGRKTHYDEMLISEVVNLSVKTVREYLEDKKIPLEKRVEVARHFAVKAMPNKIEGDSPLGFIYVVNGLPEDNGQNPV